MIMQSTAANNIIIILVIIIDVHSCAVLIAIALKSNKITSD